jgi:hypothetical protein
MRPEQAKRVRVELNISIKIGRGKRMTAKDTQMMPPQLANIMRSMVTTFRQVVTGRR